MTVGVAIAALSLGYAPKTAFAQVTTHEPYVLVDIGEFIDAAEDMTVTLGEAHDVNDDGYVVGYYMDDSDDSIPFVLDPTDGGSLMTVNMTGYDEASMLAVNSPDPFDLDDVVIAGWISVDGGGASGTEPAYWTWDSTNKEWDASLVSTTPRIVGSANAVNIDGDLAGTYINASVNKVFYYDYSAGSSADWGDGIGYGINDSGWVCGKDVNDSKAFAQKTSNLNSRVHLRKSGHTSSDAYAINNDGHVVGWSLSSPAASKRVWLWDYETTTWDTTGEELSPLPSTYVNAEANAINDADPFEVIGNYNYPDIQGGFYTLEYSSTWESINLDGHTLFPVQHLTDLLDPDTPDPVVDRCYGINNHGWIAGSFEPIEDDTPESYRPCVLIQNDMDNDGAPDMREIFTDEETDLNSNTMIDWAENDPTTTYHGSIHNMRLGLHGTRLNPAAKDRLETEIDGVQALRMIIRDNQIPNGPMPPGEDEFSLQEIISDQDCHDCSDFWAILNRWGYERGFETVVTIRTPRGGTGNSRHDKLPLTDIDARLDRVRTFSYRFARMIDYMQFGNEVLSGTGHFFIPAGADGINDTDGGLIGRVNNDRGDWLEGDDYEQGIALMLAWYEAQMEAARTGSALAGRPMRVVGPALQAHRTIQAALADPEDTEYDGEDEMEETAKNNRARHFMEAVTAMVNRQRALFDQHMYYLAYVDVENTIAALLDTNATWDIPEARTCFEWGPQVAVPIDENDDPEDFWWTKTNGGEDRIPFYFEDQTTPDKKWSPFVDEWELDQFGQAGFKVSEVVDLFEAGDADDGFAFLHALYFPPVQHKLEVIEQQGPKIWEMPALDPYSVLRLSGYIDTPYWSPLKDDFETAASGHAVSPFDPHATQVECTDACPDCETECSG